jgi:hypothetical protein
MLSCRLKCNGTSQNTGLHGKATHLAGRFWHWSRAKRAVNRADIILERQTEGHPLVGSRRGRAVASSAFSHEWRGGIAVTRFIHGFYNPISSLSTPGFLIPRVVNNDSFDGPRWLSGPARRAMRCHRTSGATHLESHLESPKAGPPKEQESPLDAPAFAEAKPRLRAGRLRGAQTLGSHDGASRSYPAAKIDRSNGSLLTTLRISRPQFATTDHGRMTLPPFFEARRIIPLSVGL